MKRTSAMLLLLCGCLSAMPARADDASKRAKVEELFAVLRVNRITEQIASSVRKQMEASLQGIPGMSQPTPAQKKVVDDYEAKIMALVNENMGWKVLEPQMLQLYSDTYSEQEIDGILAFYKSPVGHKMLEKSPELTQKSMAISQEKLMALQPQINAYSQEFSRQFAAAQTPPAQPATGAQGTSPK